MSETTPTPTDAMDVGSAIAHHPADTELRAAVAALARVSAEFAASHKSDPHYKSQHADGVRCRAYAEMYDDYARTLNEIASSPVTPRSHDHADARCSERASTDPKSFLSWCRICSPSQASRFDDIAQPFRGPRDWDLSL